MSRHRRAAGLTLVEALVLLLAFVALVAVMIVLPRLGGSRGAPTLACGSRLHSAYRAMETYASSYNGRFPIAGRATPGGAAVGFREGDRVDPATAQLDDNVTASLWVMVRDGYLDPLAYLCPAAPQGVEDRLRNVNDQPVDLAATRDFADWRSLSYSPINMYHDEVGERWTNRAGRYVVLMGDDNASDHPERATADVDHAGQHPANSPNHGWKGQNFLFGDGTVRWHETPFPRSRGSRAVIGPNVHAMFIDGEPKPVDLRHDRGDAGMHLPLLPVHGNDGFSLSGEPLDHSQLPTRREGRDFNPAWLVLVSVIIALGLGWLAGRGSRQEAEAASTSPAD